MAFTVQVWSDVVCPWCFLGKRRLERAIAAFGGDVEVIWHSFELDPRGDNLRFFGKSAAERLALKYTMPVERAELMMAQMRERGAPEGIDFSLEGGKTLSSLDAHRLLHLATEQKKQDALQERLFVAHFTETEDLGDKEVLLRLALEVGLTEQEVRAVLDSDRFTEEVREDEASARTLGITGVPFFVIGRYGVSGAQSSEVLLQTLDRASLDEPEGSDVALS